MIRFIFSLFFLVVLVCSLGLLVVPAQPISAGTGGMEDPYGVDPPYPPGYPGFWSLWPGGRVPVLISKSFVVNQFSAIDETKTIWLGLNTWRDRTGYAVEFYEILEKPVNPDDRYLYILTPDDYETEGYQKYDGYCNSWGPHTVGPTYTVLFTQNAPDGPSCINLPSIIHEVGHAIGLGHEQGRPDRDFYMTFQDPWVDYPDVSGDEVPPESWPDVIGPDPVGFFDYYSIMHTRMPPRATALSPDVSWPLPWVHLSGISDGDIDTLRALYGFDLYYYSDIAGGDFASFPLANDARGRPATQRFCQLACAADVRCKAYTYVGIGALGNNEPLCFLKDNDSDPRPSQFNIHSGKRRFDHKCSFGVAFNVDLVGDQISDVSMPDNLLNGNNCKDLCAQDPMCEAFTFVPGTNSGACTKKTHNPDASKPPFEYQRQDGYMSGVIRRAGETFNLAPTSNAGGPYTMEWVSVPNTPEQDAAAGTVRLDGTGSSDPDGASLAYFWTTDCGGAYFDDSRLPKPSMGVYLLSRPPTCSTTCNVSLIVTDDQCFRSSRSTSTVTIQDTTPPALIAVPADQSFECGAIIPAPDNVTATDTYDPSVTPTFVEKRINGSCAANYTLERTWTAVDDCGNSTSAAQIITVKDTQSPHIFCHNPFTMTPPEAPISFTATATDNCSSATPQITGFNCVGKKGNSKLESCVVEFSGSTITIRDSGGVGDRISWTVQATDNCGNTKERTCEILVMNPEHAKP